jgi:hypothetical protein
VVALDGRAPSLLDLPAPRNRARMVDIKIDETHRRTVVAHIGSKELARVIAQSVAAGSAVELDAASTSYKVIYEDETEGSPAYKTGTKARVEIVVDLAGEDRQ